ncbi:MAG: two-component system response regulator [Syntrophobacteraceae bacterium]
MSGRKLLNNLSGSRVLVVDDAKANLDILVAALRNDYKISVAADGETALALVKRNPPDLILLYIVMPRMDGYEVCRRLKADATTSSIPIIFITGMHEIEEKSKGFELGAVDYITKPFEIVELNARIRTHLSLTQAMRELAHQNQMLDSRVRERTRELQDTQLEIIYRLSRAAEYRDSETGMHIKRLSHLSRALAVSVGCDAEMSELVFHSSPMHDVGKIGIPDSILLKPSSLDPNEWRIMQTHTTIGAEILSGHDSVLIRTAKTIALSHHEKWDGSGYPQGLSQYEIPLSGRIVAICDVFDALTSVRPYKRAWPVEEALQEIRRGTGVAFDPKVVDAFFECLPEMLHIREIFSDVKPK